MTELGITVTTAAGSKDLQVSFSEADPGSTLVDAISSGMHLSSGLSYRIVRTGKVIDPDRILGDLDLLHGDVVATEPEQPRGRTRLRRIRGSGTEIAEIPQRGLRIGRLATKSDLVLDDGTVSKSHARIGLQGDAFVLEDLGSLNGTRVGESILVAPRRLEDGDVIDFGDESVFVFETESTRPSPARSGTPAAQHLRRAEGRLLLTRSYRALEPEPDGTVTIEAAPDPINTRRFPLALIVLPIILGGVMVVVLNSYMFLAFGALGPLMAIWNWWDDRRSGSKQFKESSASYRSSIEAGQHTAGRLRTERKTWLEWSTPPIRDLLGRARMLSPTLWDRHRSHPDLLRVRIGTGTLPADKRVQISERGAPELVAMATELRDQHITDQHMPIGVDLGESPVVALTGSSDATSALARAMVAQLAVRDSPVDVRLAVLAVDWHWVHWLPHCANGLKPPLVGSDADSCASVVQLIEEFAADSAQGEASEAHMVVIVQPQVPIADARLRSLLETATRNPGLSVVWICDSTGAPPEATTVIALGNAPKLLHQGQSPVNLETVERITEEDATAVARSLAPLVDPGSSTEGAVPDRVGLIDLIGSQYVDAHEVLARWRTPGDGRLRAMIGSGKDGPVWLDLSSEGDGPNGLVAGTVGAGKSEFLQSLVLALASSYSPDDVNFLFVDFKGGATFKPLLGLPHVVGMIQNLDGDLALRAQRSLQAELRRRQRIIVGAGAQKLSELRDKAPDQMEPSLVVIIDEYAELAQKLPEFLDGVVEIAQTGRALGLHLLLATQAPGQSVSRIIQNCVKYRISFRLKDSNESAEVLGRGRDASRLPNHAGRGLFLDGDTRLHEFQAAWAGGRNDDGQEPDALAVTMYRPTGAPASHASGPTDLERLLEAARGAAELGAYVAQRRPWQEPLPEVIPFDSLTPDSTQGNVARIPLGRLDLPSEQIQPPFAWDLSESQNLIVYGDARSGKTSLLRTIAASTATLCSAGSLELIGIDAGGGGLGSIDGLPNVRAVIQSQDTAGLRRAIAHLDREAASRRSRIGTAGSLDAHRRATGDNTPDLIVLVDGIAQLLMMLETIDGGSLFQAMTRLLADGAPVGIHFAVTTDQPQRLPMTIKNTARERLLLRLASRDAASTAEVNRSLAGLVNGRAFSSMHNDEVQCAVLGLRDPFDGPAQADHLAQIGADCAADHQATRLPRPSPVIRSEDVASFEVPAGHVILGLDDLQLEPVTVDLTSTPTLAVAGPDLTGRTSMLEWIATAMSSVDERTESVYLSGRGEVRSSGAPWTRSFAEIDDALGALESYASALDQSPAAFGRLLVAIDDADDLIDNPIGLPPEEAQRHKRLTTVMDTLIRSGRSAGVVVVIAGRLNALTRSVPWAQRIRQNNQALLLAPATLDVTVTDPVFGVSLPRRSGYVPTPGTAVAIRRGHPPILVQLVQP